MQNENEKPSEIALYRERNELQYSGKRNNIVPSMPKYQHYTPNISIFKEPRKLIELTMLY